MNTRRRWPAVDFRVINVPVQGPTAVPQIIDALKVLDNDDTVDVIVLARGGGSVEDLLPFSDEALCRAVFGCRTPVVSAIGHETDAPLIDYVADVRASTPTDAAKRIVPDLAEETHADPAGPPPARPRGDRPGRPGDAPAGRPGGRGRCWPAPRSWSTSGPAEVTGLRDRATRSLDQRLRRADDDLRHTLARLRALSPRPPRWSAGTRSCSGPTATWSARPARCRPVTLLRVRLADGELRAGVQE